MKNKRILYVSSEVVPYLAENEVSVQAYELPKMINGLGGQIRIFIPRYGNINERRHQLHEVIRLSGMNLVVNDMDMPLVIKVASIPKERIQVYFIDNEEYFKRKATFTDENGEAFLDNDERAIFFAKGVIETVKKLNWVPDVIHVHGWLASLVPVYLKNLYKDEGIFTDTKIVSSIYNLGFEGELNTELTEKMIFDQVDKEKLKKIKSPTFENLMQLTIDYSDAVIIGSNELPSNLTKYIETSKKPFLPFAPKEKLSEIYPDFIQNKVLGGE